MEFLVFKIMEIKSISTYKPEAFEDPSGKSLTIPGRALSIGEICRRSVIGANLPNLAFNNPLDSGSDEDFDDAFENDFDIIDTKESKENLGYLFDRYTEQQRVKSNVKPEREKQAESPDSVSPKGEIEPELNI